MARVPEDLMAVVADQGLTDAARVIAVRLYAMGEHWSELSPDDFSRMIAGYPQRDTVRKHLRQLEMAGYIERKAGGKGRSDLFRFAYSVGAESHSNADRVGESSEPNAIESENNPTLSAPVVVDVDEGSTPSISPPLLSDRVTRAIDTAGDKLAGCRGALRDYLLARVPGEPRQYGYVQTLVGWIDGTDPSVWRKPDGSKVAPDDRTPLLAAALNELAASDEGTFKRPKGEPANLKTKINILLKQQEPRNGKRDAGSTAGQGRGQATGTDGHRSGFVIEE